MIEKANILAEIRRTAAENGGRPLGIDRFEKETGIRQSDWRGRYWVNWNNAVAQAGFEPNTKTEAISPDFMLRRLAGFVEELGRFPVYAEYQLKCRHDKTFPSPTTWKKFCATADRPRKLLQYCAAKTELERVRAICQAAIEATPSQPLQAEGTTVDEALSIGYVYLLKFRSDYKIGASNDPDRRYGEVATQMPDDMIKVHTIKTDDPFGVERYWHQRFSEKRLKGEWFRLSLADVRVFKRWKTIF